MCTRMKLLEMDTKGIKVEGMAYIPDVTDVTNVTNIPDIKQRQITSANNELRDPLPVIPLDFDRQRQSNGYFNVKTYSYFKRDEASSSMQKAIRRGYVNEAIQWGLEQFWSGASKVVSNVWNRLLIISVEDVGPADPYAIVYVSQCLKDKFNYLSLCRAIAYLALTQKTRVNDWAVNVYLTYYRGQNIVSTDSLTEALKNKDASKCIGILTSLALQNDYKTFWGYIAVFVNDTYLSTLRAASKPFTGKDKIEHILFEAQAAMLWCYNKWPTTDTLKPQVTIPDDSQLSIIANDIYQHKNLVGVMDDAKDKHTKSGNKLRRSMAHFVTRGSLLNNESEVWKLVSQYYLNTFASMKGIQL